MAKSLLINVPRVGELALQQTRSKGVLPGIAVLGAVAAGGLAITQLPDGNVQKLVNTSAAVGTGLLAFGLAIKGGRLSDATRHGNEGYRLLTQATTVSDDLATAATRTNQYYGTAVGTGRGALGLAVLGTAAAR